MEEQCVAVALVSNYPPGKSVLGAVVLLHLGVDALRMRLGGAVLLSDADPRGGRPSAAVAAGLCLKTDADIGLSPETRKVSVQDRAHHQGVVLGLLRGNREIKGGLIGRILLWLRKHQFFSHGIRFRLSLPAPGGLRLSKLVIV